MFRLDGRTALVTGATGDIGRAITQHLRMAGCNVVATGTSQSRLDELARDIQGVYVDNMACNLSSISTSTDELDRMFDSAIKGFGSIDILVCNAGIAADGLILRLKQDDLRRVMSVNFEAAFRLNQLMIKHILKGNKQLNGRIINISSVVAHTGNAGQTNYTASKAALEGMSKSLAHEVATRGITVNCIAPGFIDTQMSKTIPQPAQDKLLQRIPMGRMGTVNEIAPCIVLLASDSGSYITGTVIHINGGF